MAIIIFSVLVARTDTPSFFGAMLDGQSRDRSSPLAVIDAH